MEKYACLIIVFQALEMYCCIWMFQSFAMKRRAEKRWMTPVSVIVLCCATWVITNVFYEELVIKAIVLTSVLSMIMCLLYRISYTKALVLLMLFYGVFLLADYMSLVIMGTIFPGCPGIFQMYLFFTGLCCLAELWALVWFLVSKGCLEVRRRRFSQSENGMLWRQFL